MLAKFEPGTGHTFFYTDHLGSTRLVGGSSESADDMRRDYYPYGEALTAAGNDDTPYTFVGKELDSQTGLHYFGARYYDPRIGRWYVPDALADRYLAWSPYNYGLANPVNLVDRDGDAVFLPIIAVAVAGAIIADLIDPNPANAPGPGDPVFQGKSDVEFAVGEGIGAALGIGLAKAAGRLLGTFIDDLISNPVPDKLARVVPGILEDVKKLGVTEDVFVTAAKDIEGLGTKELAQKLTIPESEIFTVLEFPTKNVKGGIATPINRSNPGFIGKGRTQGGAREFVVQNQPIPEGSTVKIIKKKLEKDK